jgi:hypothetical protein
MMGYNIHTNKATKAKQNIDFMQKMIMKHGVSNIS